MARLRVVPLPTNELGEARTTPWLLVIDRADFSQPTLDAMGASKESIGATGVLVFTDEIEVG